MRIFASNILRYPSLGTHHRDVRLVNKRNLSLCVHFHNIRSNFGFEQRTGKFGEARRKSHTIALHRYEQRRVVGVHPECEQTETEIRRALQNDGQDGQVLFDVCNDVAVVLFRGDHNLCGTHGVVVEGAEAIPG